MTQDRKYQHGHCADKKGQQNNEGKAGQSQGDKEVVKKRPRSGNPMRPGRPGNITGNKGNTTAGAQKSKGGSTGGPTSKAGR